MSSPQKREGPAPWGRVDRAINQHQHTQFTKKAPPFARSLRRGATLFVLAGSDAWEWAKDNTWMPGAKVILPPDDHPEAYRWHCAESFRDAVIVAAGHPPAFAVIAALAAALLVYLDLVLYLDPEGQAMRLNPAKRAA